MTLNGCAATAPKRLTVAAETKGRIAAGTALPDLPEECSQKMARVYPKYWVEKPRGTQLRWEFAAEFVDRRTARCSAFYEDVKTRYGAK